ncbi:MAG: amidohydrolase family protein [Gemmatimonadales bacterium]|nr:amidohydrolase family protein [Gemmatimonadales bacterium]
MLPRAASARAGAAGLLLLPLLAVACRNGPPEGTAFLHATIVDPGSRAPRPGQVLLVRRGRIDTIVPQDGFVLPEKFDTVDLAGGLVVAGLIDAGLIADRPTLRARLRGGIVAARFLGGPLDSALALRDAVRSGAVLGPRLVVSGALVDGTPGDDVAFVITDARSARRAIDSLAVAGADFVRLGGRLPASALRPLFDEARHFDLHLEGPTGLLGLDGAIDGGLRAIEGTDGFPDLTKLDSARIDALAERLARGRVALIPMLASRDSATRVAFGPLLRAVRRRGGAVLAASGSASGGLHDELDALAQAGLAPVELLAAVTRDAARFLGADSLGVLAPGAAADFLVVSGNPLDDLRALSKVERVVIGGKELR